MTMSHKMTRIVSHESGHYSITALLKISKSRCASSLDTEASKLKPR
jgi:hypothetical protein